MTTKRKPETESNEALIHSAVILVGMIVAAIAAFVGGAWYGKTMMAEQRPPFYFVEATEASSDTKILVNLARQGVISNTRLKDSSGKEIDVTRVMSGSITANGQEIVYGWTAVTEAPAELVKLPEVR